MTGLFTAFPDLRLTVEEFITEGDKVVARWTSQATHKGDLMGIAPTGKQVKQTGIAIYHIVGGKVVEEWAERDMLGFMQQLGAIPTPGQ
jgi:predicted ester cyclase